MDKLKILVAEDNQAISEALTFVLVDAGYDVKTTFGKETEKIVQEFAPNLLLLDIWMTGMDGRVICKRLKSKKSTMNIPIIMISANSDAEKIAQDAGADGFIAKPFELKHLLFMVKKHIVLK